MLRCLTLALALALAACCSFRSAQAQDAKQLVGTWKLAAWQVQYFGEEPKEPFGAHPKGRLIVAPDGYWTVLISKADRKPATNNAERAALLRSMVGYTGKFTVEGDKITSTVDISWNEANSGRNQIRYFKMEGDKLVIRSPEQSSVLVPGKRVTTTLTWEREK
jgi:Lipocalin-like domain